MVTGWCLALSDSSATVTEGVGFPFLSNLMPIFGNRSSWPVVEELVLDSFFSI